MSSMCWALGLVLLEKKGWRKQGICTQKSRGISGFHLCTKALTLTIFLEQVFSDHSKNQRLYSGWGPIKDSFTEAIQLGKGW